MNHIKDTVFQLQNRVLKHFFKSISCEHVLNFKKGKVFVLTKKIAGCSVQNHFYFSYGYIKKYVTMRAALFKIYFSIQHSCFHCGNFIPYTFAYLTYNLKNKSENSFPPPQKKLLLYCCFFSLELTQQD